MGDNIHQRAIVRHFLKDFDVYLETPWPSIYHDMPEVKLVSKGSSLRTQAKNAQRESHLFVQPPSRIDKQITVTYPPADVRICRSVLVAMCNRVGAPAGDFRMPVPDEWTHGLDLPKDKPVLIYRPLVERREWGGCPNRNPDKQAYVDLFQSIRDKFFVVSVADLQHGQEWLAQPETDADLKLHSGELDFRQLAALFRDASMVYTSPGFGVVLGQAVGTPACAVFGGYESSYSFSSGAIYTPTLGIDTVSPCECFSHTHKCVKEIDLSVWKPRLEAFADEVAEKAIQ